MGRNMRKIWYVSGTLPSTDAHLDRAHDRRVAWPPSAPARPGACRASSARGPALLVVLGAFVASGSKESCYYVDVPAGSSHDVVFVAREATRDAGIAPVLRIAEYGPSGPYWYDFLSVVCSRADGRCDRRAADDWGAVVR